MGTLTRISSPLLFMTAVLVGGCAIYAWDYNPTSETTGSVSVPAARRFLEKALLRDPGDGKPVRFVEVGSGTSLDGPITGVKVLSQRLVISTATGSQAFDLKNLYPYAHHPEAISVGTQVNLDGHYVLWTSSASPDTFPKSIADALFALKTKAGAGEADDSAGFEAALASYRSAREKPVLPEEARRFKVQADAAVREKDFQGAGELYQQGLRIAPWWPEGHFNRALALAATEDYGLAIVEMKRYLELEPDAPNARAAQDKVYEWERKAANP